MLDGKTLLNELGIPWTTSGKHSRAGWVQIKCPYCSGNPGWHGGINVDKIYYNCWRCGHHWIVQVLADASEKPLGKVRELLAKYTDDLIREDVQVKPAQRVYLPGLPFGVCEGGSQAIKYLEQRGFDVDQVASMWGLVYGGHIGEQKFRIVAPIYYGETLVSYQGRDITGRSEHKYKACALAEEVIHHKHILYGIDHVLGDHVIVVEGITDVWRLGFGAVATFGIKFTSKQVLLLACRFKHVTVFFDSDPQAQEQADLLCYQLGQFGVGTDILCLKEVKDPAALTDEDAQMIMESYLVSVEGGEYDIH